MRLYKWDSLSAWMLKGAAAEFIRQYSSNTPEAVSNAFVDLKGRIVAVFEQKLLSPSEMLIILESEFSERLKKHLEKYLFLMDTQLLPDPREVYFDLDGKSVDRFLISEKTLKAAVSEEEFTRFRLDHSLPRQGVDFDDELLLEVDEEARVSFTKGCYLGQEIIARVHYRGKPPRKLQVVTEEERAAQGGTPLTSVVQDGQKRGFSFIPQKSIDR